MARVLQPMKWDDETLFALVQERNRTQGELANALDTNVMDADFQLAIKRLKTAGRIAFNGATRIWSEGTGTAPAPRVWPAKIIETTQEEDPAVPTTETPSSGDEASGAPVADQVQTIRAHHRRGPAKSELRQYVEDQLQRHGKIVRKDIMAHFGDSISKHDMTNVLHRLKTAGRLTPGKGHGVWDLVDPSITRTELTVEEVGLIVQELPLAPQPESITTSSEYSVVEDSTDVTEAGNEWPGDDEETLYVLADSLQTFINHLVARTASDPLVNPLGIADAIVKAADYICAIARRE